MDEKTKVNVQLDPEDAEKLEALKDHYKIDKNATVLKILVRDGYDRLVTQSNVKKNAARPEAVAV